MHAPTITFENVDKQFPCPQRQRRLFDHLFRNQKKPPIPVLNKLNLSICSGEKVLFVGGNGAGKTTVLKLVCRLLEPNQGRILIDAQRLEHKHLSQMGIMLSTALLYPTLTAYQNLEHTAMLYHLAHPESYIIDAAKRWALSNRLDDLVESFSNGEKARLALARATLHEPTIMLLDEPTVYLDEPAKMRLQNFLKNTRATVLITTQDPEQLRLVTQRTVRL